MDRRMLELVSEQMQHMPGRASGHIVGWRSWLVLEMPEGLRLSGVGMPGVWLPLIPNVAVCKSCSTEIMVAPDEMLLSDPLKQAFRGVRTDALFTDCKCGLAGFYALKEPDPISLRTSFNPIYRTVTGLVALWGEVKEHEHGWRAEFAYPLGFINSFWASHMAPIYEVPVWTLEESLEHLQLFQGQQLDRKKIHQIMDNVYQATRNRSLFSRLLNLRRW